eukprot:605644-Rhodomonas_salina.1
MSSTDIASHGCIAAYCAMSGTDLGSRGTCYAMSGTSSYLLCDVRLSGARVASYARASRVSGTAIASSAIPYARATRCPGAVVGPGEAATLPILVGSYRRGGIWGVTFRSIRDVTQWHTGRDLGAGSERFRYSSRDDATCDKQHEIDEKLDQLKVKRRLFAPAVTSQSRAVTSLHRYSGHVTGSRDRRESSHMSAFRLQSTERGA